MDKAAISEFLKRKDYVHFLISDLYHDLIKRESNSEGHDEKSEKVLEELTTLKNLGAALMNEAELNALDVNHSSLVKYADLLERNLTETIERLETETNMFYYPQHSITAIFSNSDGSANYELGTRLFALMMIDHGTKSEAWKTFNSIYLLAFIFSSFLHSFIPFFKECMSLEDDSFYTDDLNSNGLSITKQSNKFALLHRLGIIEYLEEYVFSELKSDVEKAKLLCKIVGENESSNIIEIYRKCLTYYKIDGHKKNPLTQSAAKKIDSILAALGLNNFQPNVKK